MGRSLPFGRANPRYLASSLILQPKGRGLRGAEPPATQRKRHNAWSRRLLVGGSALLSSQTPPFWLLHFPLSQKGGVCEAHEAVAESGVRCGLFGRGVARRGHAVVVVDARGIAAVGAQVLERGRCGARDRCGWHATPSWLVAAEQSPVPALFSRKFPWLVKIFLDSDFTP